MTPPQADPLDNPLSPAQGMRLDGSLDPEHPANAGMRSEFVAQCQGCPTTRDPEYGGELKREWVGATLSEAEQLAFDHRESTGHQVSVLRRERFDFRLDALSPDLWAALLGAGDAGDVK